MTSNATTLARYSPYVQYDSLESFAADSAATMTDCVIADFPRGNSLRQGSEKVLAEVAPPAGESKLELSFLRAGNYSDSAKTKVSADDYLDVTGKHYVEEAREMHTRPGYGDQVYGHAKRDEKGTLWLQYWFFYYYNNKAFLHAGLHEGDWEMVQLRLGADGTPDVATYAQHAHGERCDWADVETEEGPEGPVPVVYSARGSHASYFRPGTYDQAPIVPDHNDAGGPRVRPQLNVIGDKDPAWVAWPGRWGSTKALIGPIGSDSPPGPRWHGAWRDPLAFHEDARQAEDLAPVAGADLPKPAAPTIEVKRDGTRALVSYSFPQPDPSAPKLRGILISLDGSKDGRPPATKVFQASAEPGEIEFPLDLEDRAYTVRASAVGENGITGPPSANELPV
ncbi:MAG TPA: Vps62-related protein [Solirubrobacterales bacterium]|nr:Vps62-related protein [Solirubrobacterales bacterium]